MSGFLTACAGTLLGHASSSKMKAIYDKFLASYAARYTYINYLYIYIYIATGQQNPEKRHKVGNLDRNWSMLTSSVSERLAGQLIRNWQATGQLVSTLVRSKQH